MAAVGTMKIGEHAEKSPTVYYANLKEDMLLKKKLHVLNRSEKSLVHRIRIDQKVLYKRFQNKLHRSKLTEARMWGNKEQERELRAKNLHGLNSQNGDLEEEYDFLKKLEKSKPVISKSRKPKVSIQNIDEIIDDVFKNGVPSRRPRSRSFSDALPLHTEDTKAKSAQKGKLDIPEISLAVRPSTSDGVRGFERPSAVDSLKPNKNPEVQNKAKLKSNLKRESKNTNLLQVPLTDNRARSCSPHVSREMDTPLPSVAPSRRQSTAVPSDKGKRKSASFFEQEEKVDLIKVRLDQMKELDYTDKIQDYYQTLEACSIPDQDFDYYTIRLQLAMQQSRKWRPATVPGTPEAEYKRHMGNTEVKSLTFKSLNLDFSRRDITTTENSVPWPEQLPVLSSDDESSDDGSLSD